MLNSTQLSTVIHPMIKSTEQITKETYDVCYNTSIGRPMIIIYHRTNYEGFYVSIVLVKRAKQHIYIPIECIDTTIKCNKESCEYMWCTYRHKYQHDLLYKTSYVDDILKDAANFVNHSFHPGTLEMFRRPKLYRSYIELFINCNLIPLTHHIDFSIQYLCTPRLVGVCKSEELVTIPAVTDTPSKSSKPSADKKSSRKSSKDKGQIVTERTMIMFNGVETPCVTSKRVIVPQQSSSSATSTVTDDTSSPMYLLSPAVKKYLSSMTSSSSSSSSSTSSTATVIPIQERIVSVKKHIISTKESVVSAKDLLDHFDLYESKKRKRVSFDDEDIDLNVGSDAE